MEEYLWGGHLKSWMVSVGWAFVELDGRVSVGWAFTVLDGRVSVGWTFTVLDGRVSEGCAFTELDGIIWGGGTHEKIRMYAPFRDSLFCDKRRIFP